MTQSIRRPLTARLRGLLLPLTLVGATLALGACSDAILAIRGASPAYDGAWVGQFNLSTRTRACNLTRGGIRLTIENGVIDGKVRQPEQTLLMAGYVQKDGTLEGGRTIASFETDNTELIGTFTEREAEGRWTSKLCNGSWNLRKIR